MKKLLAAALLMITTLCWGQLLSPSEFLKYELGTQFSRHSDIVAYYRHVAAQSDMVRFDTYGHTYERRPLTYALVSSADNLSRIKQIQEAHLQNAGLRAGSSDPETAIVWLSFNVHGNEASSSEAAMLSLYRLVTENNNWLDNTVVILDPCINPDGRDRYANWYNQVKATPFDLHRLAREHQEPWPGGRPNHYLFDLNRDWAWATQIETQHRLKMYNKWMPHIHVDFHEQGMNEPYFFAPAAEPYHDVITGFQREFQHEIGRNHARYFDAKGWLYFTRERFDLLYPSYGDTYPTFMGGIGMTYEQAGHGRAGLGIVNDNGLELTLKDRIAHHTTTALSTVEVASKNAGRLNEEFGKFFDNSDLKYKTFVLVGRPDNIRALARLLDRHEIGYGYTDRKEIRGTTYGVEQGQEQHDNPALLVRTDQPKGKMVKVLLEPKAVISDPLTYDITAWSLPYAYGLQATASTELITPTSGSTMPQQSQYTPTKGAVAYVGKWNSMEDGRFLATLLQEGFKPRFTEKPLEFQGQKYDRGSLLIIKGEQPGPEDFDTRLLEVARRHQRALEPVMTGFSDNGTDLGSPDIKMVHKLRIAILAGEGSSSLSYGALWHFFEQQLHYPVTSVNTDMLGENMLRQFDVVILPSGRYGQQMDKEAISALRNWVREGGKLIALAGALRSLEGEDGFGLELTGSPKGEQQDTTKLIPYAERERSRVDQLLTGSVVEVTLDPTHPMAFGYDPTYFSLKLGSRAYKFLDSGYNVGVIRGPAKVVSGFAGEQAVKKLENSMVFGEKRMGRGSVVYLADDVLFRAFWENGKLLLVNSIFFVNNNPYTL